jgi:hemoglobin
MRTTLYDQIGGAPAVTAVVDALYDRILADAGLMRYFDGTDLGRLKAHQRALVAVALGGSTEDYRGRMMHPAHAGLAITDGAFDTVLGHLVAVLDDVGVAPATAARVVAIVQPIRADVVQAQLAVVR